jgi:hypothetical protein
MNMKYQNPTCRSIALGGILFLALMIGALRSAELVKLAGSPLLLLPEKLHMIETLRSSDVIHFHYDGPMEFEVDFAKSGRYAVYTADTTFLLSTNARIQDEKPPLLHVIETSSGAETPVYYFRRGVKPFDTRFARGRPIYGFEIERPGRYVISSPWMEAALSLTPDYTTGKEGVLSAVFLLESGVLFAPLGLLLYRKYLKDRRRARQLDDLKRIDPGDFWQRQYKNRR